VYTASHSCERNLSWKKHYCAHPGRRTHSVFALDHELLWFAWGRGPREAQLASLGLYEPAGVVVAEVKVYRRERDEQRAYDVPEYDAINDLCTNKNTGTGSLAENSEEPSCDELSNVFRSGQLYE
jgi:hypothetical protein